MILIWVRAKVEDFNTWKPVFDSRAGVRRAAGEISGRTFYNADNPNDLVLLLEWDSRTKAEAFFHSDAARKNMADAGVVGTPELVFVEESRQLRRTAAD